MQHIIDKNTKINGKQRQIYIDVRETILLEKNPRFEEENDERSDFELKMVKKSLFISNEQRLEKENRGRVTRVFREMPFTMSYFYFVFAK